MRPLGRLNIFLVFLPLLLPGITPAEAQLKKLNIAYSATSPYQAPLIIAKQAGFFYKKGLDVSLIFTPGGSLGIQAMIGGDLAMVLSDGSAAVAAALGGADVAIVASLLNTFPYSLISLPEIKKVDQLKGAKIAVSRFGSATDVGVRMTLARLGLNPERDITLLQIGAQTARVAALQSKNVQATIITPPFTLAARKQGYTALIDMARLNIPFQVTALLTTRAFIRSQHDLAFSIVAAVAQAIHFYKTEKEHSIEILSKYLQTADREALEETYREIALKVVPEKPYPTLPGLRTIIDELATRNPKAKGARPEDFVDQSFVKRLDDENFFGQLYKR